MVTIKNKYLNKKNIPLLIFIVLILVLLKFFIDKSNNPKGFRCPMRRWDCMPEGPSAPTEPNCTSEFIEWAKENCGGISPTY